jgi:hypothetical protein
VGTWPTVQGGFPKDLQAACRCCVNDTVTLFLPHRRICATSTCIWAHHCRVNVCQSASLLPGPSFLVAKYNYPSSTPTLMTHLGVVGVLAPGITAIMDFAFIVSVRKYWYPKIFFVWETWGRYLKISEDLAKKIGQKVFVRSYKMSWDLARSRISKDLARSHANCGRKKHNMVRSYEILQDLAICQANFQILQDLSRSHENILSKKHKMAFVQ